MTDVTLMIKTIARPDCLVRLLESIRAFYPDTPIIIGDDSKEPYPDVAEPFNVDYHVLEFNTGAPASYNYLMGNIETPYVALLDDDFIFEEKTRLEDLRAWVKSGAFDVMGGSVVARGRLAAFVGDLYWKKDTLEFRRFFTPMPKAQKGPLRADVILNFFVTKTETLKKCQWDPELKVFRHLDWYITAQKLGLEVGYLPSVRVLHDHKKSGTYYEDLRHGAIPDYKQMFREKHGIKDVIGDG